MTGWPPTKGELEGLYLDEKLSADDIAARFGRTGKYPGAIVYHYLRKYGIPIRDRTAHQRHMDEEEIGACVVKYRDGKSLWDLADEYHFSAETIRKELIRNGVETRDKVEAQIQKVTKHKKHPFSGDPHEKAYLYGLRQGDLWVTRHGRAIRVKTSSTHPAMIELVASCFLPYGAVHILPRRCKMTGYEWSIDCDVDESFGFLEQQYATIPAWIDEITFGDYLAGFFDAEGSLALDGNHKGNPRLAITNNNLNLLQDLRARIRPSFGEWNVRVSTPAGLGGEAIAKRDVWQLMCWRNSDCVSFLTQIPFRHPEKKAKARIVLRRFKGESILATLMSFDRLRNSIRLDKELYRSLAQRELDK